MATRNFWLDVNVDGRGTELAGGPRAKDGGFYGTITMKQEGSVSPDRLKVRGWVWENGENSRVQAEVGYQPGSRGSERTVVKIMHYRDEPKTKAGKEARAAADGFTEGAFIVLPNGEECPIAVFDAYLKGVTVGHMIEANRVRAMIEQAQAEREARRVLQLDHDNAAGG